MNEVVGARRGRRANSWRPLGTKTTSASVVMLRVSSLPGLPASGYRFPEPAEWMYWTYQGSLRLPGLWLFMSVDARFQYASTLTADHQFNLTPASNDRGSPGLRIAAPGAASFTTLLKAT